MDRYRVKLGSRVDLGELDPNDKSVFPVKKKEGRKLLLGLNQRLESLQELLYSEHKHKVLIVLQAMDTGGKDGTIRHVFEGNACAWAIQYDQPLLCFYGAEP